MESLNADWEDNDFVGGSTSGPEVSMSAMSPELPTVTIAAVIGVTMLVLITIAAVFLLGVLFDCRHQRLLEEKQDEVSRKRNQRKLKTADKEHIVENMEGNAQSEPPELGMRDIP